MLFHSIRGYYQPVCLNESVFLHRIVVKLFVSAPNIYQKTVSLDSLLKIVSLSNFLEAALIEQEAGVSI